MKKIFIGILILFSFGNTAFAEGEEVGPVKVRIGMDLPFIECTEEEDKEGKKTGYYKCDVERGTGQVVIMLGSIIKYFTFIVGLLGVLFIVYSGIMYSMGGLEQSLKEESKKRIIQTLIGLIILLLSGYILQLIAPWVFK